ncbi:MAG: VanZ family protein [Oceanococcus sp.]
MQFPSFPSFALYGLQMLRLAYLLVLGLATLAGAQFAWDLGLVAQRFAELGSGNLSGRDWLDALRNVLLFAGWGVVYVLTSTRDSGRAVLQQVTVSAALISVSVEALQLFSSVRTTSVLDLMTNILGATAAAWALLKLLAYLRTGRGGFLFLPTAAMTLACWVLTLFPPGRSLPLAGVYGGPMQRANAIWHSAEGWTWSLGSLDFFDLLLYLPTGFFLWLCLRQFVSSLPLNRQKLVVFAAIVVSIAIFTEWLRCFVGLPVQLGLSLAHAAILCVGAGAAMLWTLSQFQRSQRLLEQTFLLSFISLILWSAWHPFKIIPSWSQSALMDGRFYLLPMAAYRQQVDISSVAEVLANFSLYLGAALLCVVDEGKLGAWRKPFWLLFGLACSTELLQIVLVGRYFDTTDILVPVAAILCAFRLRRT